MAGGPLVLNPAARDIVERAIRDHCELRGWSLLALNVRRNHVHVVVACPPDVPPERVLVEFKAWSTRRLRSAGQARSQDRVWTEHGSTRWINTASSLAAAIAYVNDGQSRDRFRA